MLRSGSRAYFSSPSSLWLILNYRKEVDECMQYSSSLLPSLGVEVRMKASWMWKSNCEIWKSLLQKYNGRSHDHISEYQVLKPFIPLSYHHSLYMAWKRGYWGGMYYTQDPREWYGSWKHGVIFGIALVCNHEWLLLMELLVELLGLSKTGLEGLCDAYILSPLRNFWKFPV